MSRQLHLPAEWSPSRFHYAFFRLVAWALVRNVEPQREQEGESRVFLTFRPWQHPAEPFVLSIFYVASATLYVVFAFQRLTGAGVPLLIALLVPLSILMGVLLHFSWAGVALLLLILKKARLLRMESDVDAQATAHNAIMTVLAAAALTSDRWIRWVGVLWMAALIVNACSAVVLLSIRGRVREVQRRLEP